MHLFRPIYGALVLFLASACAYGQVAPAVSSSAVQGATSMASFWPTTLVAYAQVLGAFATTGAVILSLYLARRVPIPKLLVRAGLRIIVTQGGQRGKFPEFVSITVTNIGASDALIRSIGWNLPGRLHRLCPWLFKGGPLGIQDTSTPNSGFSNPTLPAKLAHGEELQFMLPNFGPANWLGHIENRGLFNEELKSRTAASRIRVMAVSSVGKPTMGEIEDDFAERIWEAQSKYLMTLKKS